MIVVTVAFVQEYRSEKSLEALNKLMPHFCHVVREDRVQSVLAQELVPGDLVVFSMGDRIPADVRLTQSTDLEIDESNLSGETTPSRKTTQAIMQASIPVIERKNIAFMGTLVRAGHGRGLVVGTGKQTEFGSIWSMMQEVEEKKTPLQLRMDQLGKQLSLLSFGVIGVISLIGLLQGREWLDTFTIAVSLAVAAIPEGLPIVVTVTLALGVLRMANKHAIVKRLPSVESLGSVNQLCADKTGTLTMNKMTISQLFTLSDGTILMNIPEDTLSAIGQRLSVQTLMLSAALCTNAELRDGTMVGQPTEIAILEALDHFRYRDERHSLRKHAEIPFDSDQKWMATQYEVNGNSVYFVKGAPEVVIERCKKYSTESGLKHLDASVGQLDLSHSKPLTGDMKKTVLDAATRSSNQGLRVLAVALGSDLRELIFAGLLAMSDPPRPEAANTILKLRSCGVRVVMITGDAKGTAMSIASQLGILPRSENEFVMSISDGPSRSALAVSGAELDVLGERELQDVVGHACVYYRTTPKHKLAIVRALKQRYVRRKLDPYDRTGLEVMSLL